MHPIQQELLIKKTLKKFLRECDYLFLKNLLPEISEALETKRIQYDAEQAEKAEREKKLTELKALIASEGFSIAELSDDHREEKRTSSPRKPKYVYTENGVQKYWSGVGRMPLPIKTAIESGESLDNFLIESGS